MLNRMDEWQKYNSFANVGVKNICIKLKELI